MRYPAKRLLALAVLGAALGPVQAGGPPPRAGKADSGVKPGAMEEVRRVAAKIDEHIDAGLDKHKVKPAPLADDDAFFRRASLDVAGKIPLVNDARKFLADRSSDKRLAAVQRLLDGPAYANNLTILWRDLLIPEAKADLQRRYLLPSMDVWLRKKFAANVPFDQLVRELVSAPMSNRPDEMYYYGGQTNNGSPMAFYMAKQAKPEEIATSITRVFLGIRLECAQCHDHPKGSWRREEFWSQAAFFGGLKGQSNGDFFYGPIKEAQDRRELNIPNTDRVAAARFLDGKQPKWKFKVGARTTLADWMTAKDNRYFARAIVNRMWAHFFGVGLVDPVDDMVEDNAASHPELLAMLASEFVKHDFDLKFLIRAITASRAYQRSSAYDSANPSGARLFARMSVKGMTSEQLFDSISQATGYRDNLSVQQRVFSFNSPRQLFADKFADQEKKTEYLSSIPQALTMMNNQLITEATHPDRSVVLGALLASSFMTDAGRIEALYLAALSRKPRPEEAAKFLRYVEKGGASGDKKKALSDVFWALLNSTEFKFNH